jgi:hypothetical protein
MKNKSHDAYVKISKFLSLVLRHSRETIRLNMDENGWVDINESIDNANKYKHMRFYLAKRFIYICERYNGVFINICHVRHLSFLCVPGDSLSRLPCKKTSTIAFPTISDVTLFCIHTERRIFPKRPK